MGDLIKLPGGKDAEMIQVTVIRGAPGQVFVNVTDLMVWLQGCGQPELANRLIALLKK